MNQAVVKKDKAATLLNFIGARRSHIEKAMGELARRVLPPTKILDLLNVAITRNPDLLECTQESVFFAVQKAVECGLDFTGKGGQGWLIPFKNGKTGQKEAVFVPGYKGLRLNLIRSETCQRIVSRVVYDGDEFHYAYGMEDVLIHVPKGSPGENPKEVWQGITHAYAIASFEKGTPQFVVMDKMELIRVRNTSKGKDRPDSEWQVWPDLACAKTAVRRLANQLDVDPSSLAQTTLEADAAAETGQSAAPTIAPDMTAIEPPETVSQTERLKRDIKAEREQSPAQEPAEEPEESAEPESQASEPEPPEAEKPPQEEIAPPAKRTPKKDKEPPVADADSYELPAGNLGTIVSEALQKLAKHGVTAADVQAYMESPLSELNQVRVNRLVNLALAIDNGDITWKGVLNVQKGSATKKGGQFTITGGKKVMVNLLRVGYIKPADKGTGTMLVFDPGQQETGIPSNIVVQEPYATVAALLGDRKVKP